MRTRAVAGALGLATLFALTSSTVAAAKYRGTDLWSNLMPGTGDGLVDRYPLSHYALDYHVDAPHVGFGGVSSGDPIAGITQFTASFLFSIGVLMMRVVIAVFDWAYPVDLVSGKNGMLGLASTIAQNDYQQVVKPLLVVAVICFGVWLLLKIKGSGKSRDAGGGIVRVLVMSAVAIAIVFYPAETIGRLYAITDDLAVGIISHGDGARSASDRLFGTFIYRNWAVLQFSGLRVCTGAKTDGDGFPLAATADNPAKVCHPVLRKGDDGHGDYARRFLRYAPDSDERKAEYDALREGSAPDTQQFADVKIDRTDAPAVDLMQAGGAGQRLLFVLPILAGMGGATLLLGLIILGVVFAQLALVMLFLAAPFMVLMSVFPPLHRFYVAWINLIGTALVGKVVLSLLFSIVLHTSDGLELLAGTNRVGYLLVFLLQALLYIGAFWKRKAILDKVASSKTAESYMHHENQAVSFVSGAAATSLGAISGGASTFANTMREGWSGHHGAGQQHAQQPDSSSPPASAGREYSPPGEPGVDYPASSREIAASLGVPSAPDASMNDSEETQMPTRSFQEDLEAAREQPPAARPRLVAAGADSDQSSEPTRSEPLRSFADELEVSHLARERPLPPEQFERARLRDDRIPERDDLER